MYHIHVDMKMGSCYLYLYLYYNKFEWDMKLMWYGL